MTRIAANDHEANKEGSGGGEFSRVWGERRDREQRGRGYGGVGVGRAFVGCGISPLFFSSVDGRIEVTREVGSYEGVEVEPSRRRFL